MTALTGFKCDTRLAREPTALAGKLLADMGADVILVEPIGGDPARQIPPFFEDRPGPDRSLWCGIITRASAASALDLRQRGGAGAIPGADRRGGHPHRVRTGRPARRAGPRP